MQHPAPKKAPLKRLIWSRAAQTHKINLYVHSACFLSLAHTQTHAKPCLLVFETDSERLHALFHRALGEVI